MGRCIPTPGRGRTAAKLAPAVTSTHSNRRSQWAAAPGARTKTQMQSATGTSSPPTEQPRRNSVNSPPPEGWPPVDLGLCPVMVKNSPRQAASAAEETRTSRPVPQVGQIRLRQATMAATAAAPSMRFSPSRSKDTASRLAGINTSKKITRASKSRPKKPSWGGSCI